ncbi:MAG: zinc ribbon domain-containing protein [Blastocatellia bacterium]|nr:zinc ribbon domain-containing protein [Blastocatellia bacterium]
MKCRTEVRSGSAFCYNCGADLSPADAEAPIPRPAFNETDQVGGARSSQEIEAPPIPPPSGSVYEPASGADKPGQLRDKPKSELRPASEIRRKRKPTERSVVEYVWEEPSGVTISFAAAAIILTLLTVGIVAVAMYLR